MGQAASELQHVANQLQGMGPEEKRFIEVGSPAVHSVVALPFNTRMRPETAAGSTHGLLHN